MNYLELRSLMANPEELSNLYARTIFLGLEKKIPIRRRLWHVDNNILTIPVCKTCKMEEVSWSEKTSEYRRFCSSKCAHQSDEVREKTEATCVEKYGHRTNFLSEENKEKQRATCLEKYGVDNFAKSKLFTVRNEKTCMDRYGVKNVALFPEFKDKMDATNQARYGRKRKSQAHIPEHIIALKDDEAIMRSWFYDLKMPVSEIAEILNVSVSQLCVHFRNNLNIDISRHNISTIERKVGEYITSLSIEFESSNRTIIKPKELDIFVPSYNIAIEINGIAWHGELRGKNNTYHLEKMNKCNAQQIRLIQILDHEWNNKQDIVKSRLSGIFGKNTRIWARKCIIKPISAAESRAFFEKCHIQGYSSQSVAYGLFYENILVSAMSFCKSRYNKKYQWELLRYANCLNTNVIGGAGKLFAHFKKIENPISVISYCDLRWNTGNLYEKIGFNKIKQSGPNYMYTKNGNLYSRIKFQKHKLHQLLEDYDPNLTEWDNMRNNKYDRIWDCGNLVFVY